MKEHGMPLGELEDDGKVRVLLVGTDGSLKGELERLSPDGLLLETATDAFTAGSAAQEFQPKCAVIDTRTLGEAVPSLIDGFRSNGFGGLVLIGIVGAGATGRIAQLDETFRDPFDAALLLERIRTLVSRNAA